MRFLISRFLQMIIVFIVISFVGYFLIDLMPGDPLTRLKQENPNLKPADLDKLAEQMGIKKPLHMSDTQWFFTKYYRWLVRVSSGDLGYSTTYKVKVETMIFKNLLTTLKVSIPVLLMTLIISIPIGTYIAIRQYSTFDYAMNLIAFIGFSLPTFLLGLLLIFYFSQVNNIFPPGGLGTPGVNNILDDIRYLILPVFVLSFYSIGRWVRYIRGTLLEVLKQDYVRTARAKGLSEDVVILKHAVRNALIPFITIFALSIPVIFSGALVTETVFGIHGMGRLLYQSIIDHDSDIAMTSFLFIAILTLIFNFVADILYSIIDPRIRIKKS